MSTVEASPPTGQPAPQLAAATGSPGPRRGHLDAVDVIRVVMIGGVIAVHLVGFTVNPANVLAGGAAGILHINREVFFALSAFVLTYSYATRKNWTIRQFWAKRYWLVGVPYVVWTAIYFLADGSEHRRAASVVAKLASDLLTGAARYHMYFLLVTMQIYAIFPLLLWLLRATRRHHWGLMAVALACQTALTVIHHFRLAPPPGLGFWFNHLDPYVISYPFYVVIGGVAAMHFESVTAWVRGHMGLIRWLVAVGFAVSVGSFCLDFYLLKMNAAQAGEVFQPVVAITTMATVLGLYALGVKWADKGPRRRGQTAVKVTSDATFGVYLSHPLLLQVLLAIAAPWVTEARSGRIPALIVLAVDLVVIVPAILVVNTAAVAVLRRTPLSLPLTGRARSRPVSG